MLKENIDRLETIAEFLNEIWDKADEILNTTDWLENFGYQEAKDNYNEAGKKIDILEQVTEYDILDIEYIDNIAQEMTEQFCTYKGEKKRRKFEENASKFLENAFEKWTFKNK